MNSNLMGFPMSHDPKPEIDGQTPAAASPGAERGGLSTGSSHGAVSRGFAAALADGVAAARQSHATGPEAQAMRAGAPRRHDQKVIDESGDVSDAPLVTDVTDGTAAEARASQMHGRGQNPLRGEGQVSVETRVTGSLSESATRPGHAPARELPWQMTAPSHEAPLGQRSSVPTRSVQKTVVALPGGPDDPANPDLDAVDVPGSPSGQVATPMIPRLMSRATSGEPHASPRPPQAGRARTLSVPAGIPPAVNPRPEAGAAGTRSKALLPSLAREDRPIPRPPQIIGPSAAAWITASGQAGRHDGVAARLTMTSRPPRHLHAGAEPGPSPTRSSDVIARPIPSTAVVSAQPHSHVSPQRLGPGFARQQFEGQASRPSSAYPTPPMLAATPATMPEPVAVPSPLRSFEPRRVRAAVLELQHRISGGETVASVPSHVVFGTNAHADKAEPRRRTSILAFPASIDDRRASSVDARPTMPGGEPDTTHEEHLPSLASRSRAGAPRSGRSDRSRSGEAGELPHDAAAQLFFPAGRAALVAAEQLTAFPGTAGTPASPTLTSGSAPDRPAIQGRGAGARTTADASVERHHRGEAQAASSDATRPVPPSLLARPSVGEPPSSGGGAGIQPTFGRDGGPILLPGAPLAAGALVDLALEDPTLHAAALGKHSHVRLDTGGGGELALHMRVEDGVLDLRVEGSAARTIDIRQHELRTALASEGISLGHFESAPQPQAEAHAGPSKDAADAVFNAPSGAGQTPSHSGANLGGGGRHFEAGDRWSDRETPAAPRAGSTGSSRSPDATDSDDDRSRRRGFHVTA